MLGEPARDLLHCLITSKAHVELAERQDVLAASGVTGKICIMLALTPWCMQGVLMVDTLTWLVLVPMLRSNPDAAKVRWAEKMFFNFYSYNTVSAAHHCHKHAV